MHLKICSVFLCCFLENVFHLQNINICQGYFQPHRKCSFVYFDYLKQFCFSDVYVHPAQHVHCFE